MRRHITTVLFPANAALSFGILASLSIHLPLESFALVSFTMAIGSYLAVIVNFGQDQTQINGLLSATSVQDRLAYFFSRQALSLFILLTLVSSYYLIDTLFGHSNQAKLIGTLSLVWAAMIGLFPNAYIDYLDSLVRQQTLIFIERLMALSIIFLFFQEYDSSELTSLLALLVMLRLVVVGIQYATCITRDRQERPNRGEEERVFPSQPDGSARVAVAQILNSLGLYGALFIFRNEAAVDDVAVVSFSIQCSSFASLIPAVYIRRNLREFANFDANGGQIQNAVILSQARDLMRMALIAATITIAIIWFWLAVMVPWEARHGHFATGFIVGVWAIAMSYGMRLSRAIIHRREISFYTRWAFTYSSASLVLSYFLGKELGALGFMAGVVVPHALVITRYHFFIARGIEVVK